MNLSSFARIGKAPLLRALGLQKNYKETQLEQIHEIDRQQSGCYFCANYKNIEFQDFMPQTVRECSAQTCQYCPHAVFHTVSHAKTIYHNEKNQFGYAPRLKKNGIMLLLLYHFCGPDSYGTCKNLIVKDLADLLHCSIRSIHNTNRLLQQYGYILYGTGAFPGTIHVILPEYKNYGLSAREGGRGYATFSLEEFQAFLSISDLNQLRVFLRTAFAMETSREQIISHKLESIRRFLPDYCKPGIIRKALSSISSLFKVTFHGDDILFESKDIVPGKQQLNKEMENSLSLLHNHIDTLDRFMKEYNDCILNHKDAPEEPAQELARAGIHNRTLTPMKKQLYVRFQLSETDYQDLARLCVTYSYDQVISHLGYIYDAYLSRFKLKNIGALMRTILKEQSHNNLEAAF